MTFPGQLFGKREAVFCRFLGGDKEEVGNGDEGVEEGEEGVEAGMPAEQSIF